MLEANYLNTSKSKHLVFWLSSCFFHLVVCYLLFVYGKNDSEHEAEEQNHVSVLLFKLSEHEGNIGDKQEFSTEEGQGEQRSAPNTFAAVDSSDSGSKTALEVEPFIDENFPEEINAQIKSPSTESDRYASIIEAFSSEIQSMVKEKHKTLGLAESIPAFDAKGNYRPKSSWAPKASADTLGSTESIQYFDGSGARKVTVNGKCITLNSPLDPVKSVFIFLPVDCVSGDSEGEKIAQEVRRAMRAQKEKKAATVH